MSIESMIMTSSSSVGNCSGLVSYFHRQVGPRMGVAMNYPEALFRDAPVCCSLPIWYCTSSRKGQHTGMTPATTLLLLRCKKSVLGQSSNILRLKSTIYPLQSC